MFTFVGTVQVRNREGAFQTSEIKESVGGVPQGGICSPVLYLLYVNSILRNVNRAQNSCTIMYADDTNILVTSDTPEEGEILANILVNELTQAFAEHDLLLNAEKTVVLQYEQRTSSFSPAITIDDTTVRAENTAKILGLWTDSALTMLPHIAYLECKLSSGIYVLRRLAPTNSQETRKLAYHALVESHIRYGIEEWGVCSHSNMRRIFRKQKKAVRIVAGVGYRESCRTLFPQLELLTVPALYMLACCQRVHNNRQNYQQLQRGPATRGGHLLYIPRHHGKNPTERAKKIYNALPGAVKEAVGQKAFLKSLKAYLIQSGPYEVALGQQEVRN